MPVLGLVTGWTLTLRPLQGIGGDARLGAFTSPWAAMEHFAVYFETAGVGVPAGPLRWRPYGRLMYRLHEGDGLAVIQTRTGTWTAVVACEDVSPQTIIDREDAS